METADDDTPVGACEEIGAQVLSDGDLGLAARFVIV
jgi:hypothetical protein